MKKLTLAALFAVLGTLAFAADLKPYDDDVMIDLMQSNVKAYSGANKAVAAGDWAAAAEGFKLLAANAEAALTYAPESGDAALWKSIWTDFKNAADSGVEAAKAKDAAKAKTALDALAGDRNKGHKAFRS